jgi:hypothetical protein
VVEGPLPVMIDVVAFGAPVRAVFHDVANVLGRVPFAGGLSELVIGVRKDLPNWVAPLATEQEYLNHRQNWDALNGAALLAALPSSHS